MSEATTVSWKMESVYRVKWYCPICRRDYFHRASLKRHQRQVGHVGLLVHGPVSNTGTEPK